MQVNGNSNQQNKRSWKIMYEKSDCDCRYGGTKMTMTIWLIRLSNCYNVAVVTIKTVYIIGLSGTIVNASLWTVLVGKMFDR